MKQIWILTALLLCCTACSAPQGSTAESSVLLATEQVTEPWTETAAPASETDAELPEVPDADIIQAKVDAYFRMFYERNSTYHYTEVFQDRGTNGTYLMGYYDGDALTMMLAETYGERSSGFVTYYFIDEHLTYAVNCSNHQWPLPRTQSFRAYYIIDGIRWAYDAEADCLVQMEDDGFLEYFAQDLQALTGGNPLVFPQYTEIPPSSDSLYGQCICMKNSRMQQLYSGETYTVDGEYFHVDLPNYYNAYRNRYFQTCTDVNLLLAGETPCVWSVGQFEGLSYTGYTYYPLDEHCIYAVVYEQVFEESVVAFDKMLTNQWSEYYIVDGVAMQYDAELQDLVEVSGDALLEHYAIAAAKYEI